MNITSLTHGGFDFRPFVPSGLEGWRMSGSQPFTAQESFGTFFYQKVETKSYKIWQSIFHPTDNITVYAVCDEPWLGFRLLLKQHIHHFTEEGDELYLKQGQFNFAYDPKPITTYKLLRGKQYEVFDMCVTVSFLKKIKVEGRLLEDFIHQLNMGDTLLAVHPFAWGNVELLDAIAYLCRYPKDISAAQKVLEKVIVAWSKPPLTDLSEEIIEKLFKARDFIKSDLLRHIHIREVAKYAALNEQYLKTGFRQVFGYGPYRYLQYERLEAAKLLLKESRYPLKEVASRTGFGFDTSLNHAFKKKFNITPSRWRRLIQKQK